MSWGGITGSWKPNSLAYITQNAYNSLKNFLGNVWFSLVKGFNIPTSSCPPVQW